MRLILIDGWGATAAVWKNLPPALQDCRTVEWTEALADPAGAVAAAAEDAAEGVWLGGWSLGGMLALEAAGGLRSGGGVRGLLLAATTARMCADDGWPGVEPRLLKAMKLRLRREPAAQMNEFAELCFRSSAAAEGGVPDPVPAAFAQVCAEYARAAAQHDPALLLAGLDYLLQKDLRPLLPALAGLPAVILHGGADSVIPAAAAQALGACLPGARKILVPQAPHALPLTHPEAIMEAAQTMYSGSSS